MLTNSPSVDFENTKMDPVSPASSQRDARKAKKALKRRRYKLKLKHRSPIVGDHKVQGVQQLGCKSNLLDGSKSSALATIAHGCIVQHDSNGTVHTLTSPSSLVVAIPDPVEVTPGRPSTQSPGIQRPSSAESTSRFSEDPKQRRQRLKNKRRNDRRREERLNAWKTKQDVLKGSTSERIKTSIVRKPSASSNAGFQMKDPANGCSTSLRSVKKACPLQGGDLHRATRHSSVSVKKQITGAFPVSNLVEADNVANRGLSRDKSSGHETHDAYIKTGIMLGSSQKVEAQVGSVPISESNTKSYAHSDIGQTAGSNILAQSSGCRHPTQTGSLGSTDVQLAFCISLERSQVMSAETALMETANRTPTLEEVCNMNTTAASVNCETAVQDSTVQVVDSNLMVANEGTTSSTGIKSSVAGLMDVLFNSVGDQPPQVNSGVLGRQRSKTLDSVILPTLEIPIRRSKTLSALDTSLCVPVSKEFIESKSSLVIANASHVEEFHGQDNSVPSVVPLQLEADVIANASHVEEFHGQDNSVPSVVPLQLEADPSSATVEKPTSATVVSSLQETNVLDLKGEIRCGLLINESSLKIEPKDVVTEDLQVTPLRNFPSTPPLAKKVHNKGSVIRDQQDAVKTKILAAIKARKETERLAMEKLAAEKEAKRKTKNRLKKQKYASRKLKRVNAKLVDTEMNVKAPKAKVESEVIGIDAHCALESIFRNGVTDIYTVNQRENIEGIVEPISSAAVANFTGASAQEGDNVETTSSDGGENSVAAKRSKRNRNRKVKSRKPKQAPITGDDVSVLKTVTPQDTSFHGDLAFKKTSEADSKYSLLSDDSSLEMSVINSESEESSGSGVMTPEPKANAIDSSIVDPNIKSCIMQQLAVNLGGNSSSMDSLMDLLLRRADTLESKMLAGTLVPNTEEECVAREKNAANLTNDVIRKKGITPSSGLNGETMHVSDMETEVSAATEESRANYDSIESDQVTKDRSSENDLLPSAQSSLVESRLLLSLFQRESQPSAFIKNSLAEPLLTLQDDDFVETTRATQPVQEVAHASSDRVDTLQKDTKSTERNSFTKTPRRVIFQHAVCILEGTRYYRARVTVTEDSRIKIVKLKGGLDELGGSNDILEYLTKLSSAQKPKRSN
ncbi:hypothetical protein BKA69DRAFT_1042728 [Paraphysoderma sedebokerense]|nr:hypothetical protein BKA69DRAFT_1042728 [Paraphysoderma sedebokerense]